MPETLTTRCCIAGGGPAGMMLGLPAGARRRRRRRAGEAQGFPARLPRRHHPSLDARADARARPARRVPQAAARSRRRASVGPLRQPAGDHRRLPPPADALQVHRADAAVGLPEFPRRAGPPLSGLPSADAGRGDGPDRGGRPRRRRARARRRTAPLEDPRRARRRLRRPPFRRARQGRPCGRDARRADGRAVVPACRASPTTASRPAACFCPAASSSCSTAATTGNAPM